MKRKFGLQLSVLVVLAASLVLGACSPAATPVPPQPTAVAQVAATEAPAPTAAAAKPTATPWAITPGTLRLATTTSTADTGLLDWLLPQYEKATGVHVDVVAVGTGQAIAIGKAGDCDVLLVHARAQEDAFVKAGDAKERFDVMYNDFVIVGPPDDPAHIASAANAVAAFQDIANTQNTFVSRGDGSGTQTKELSIWASAKITPTKSMAWYNSIGQGMGETLVFTNEKGGYTLSDRGTWLATASKLPNLKILLGADKLADNKDKTLLNPYGIMAVNPDKHPGVQYDMAMKFVQWFKSAATMKIIGSYGLDKYGQPLFYPDSAEYKAAQAAAQ
jgi:tungstate transport system substrate-binding protein